MALAGHILFRAVFVVCFAILVINCFNILLNAFVGQDEDRSVQTRIPPRPTNPGYGDSKAEIDLDADIEHDSIKNLGTKSSSKLQLLATIKNACLPKLICELTASSHKDKLSDSEKSLLSLIRETTISTTAELTSKYHFAAHMGQLIAGIDGNGCHNFYPTCPFPGLQVLQMMKKVRMR